jgi:hypothetical protein
MYETSTSLYSSTQCFSTPDALLTVSSTSPNPLENPFLYQMIDTTFSR